MPQTTNKAMLAIVANGLGDLINEVVFVGGAITELYIADTSLVAEVRQTDDVDCIIEIASRSEYAALEEQLRKLKFENDQKVICRWNYQGIIVDIMPTDEDILGFSNRWYKEGIQYAIPYELPDGITIHTLALPYFICCKLEALFDRGIKDIRLSKDFEDIVFILNYSITLPEELSNSNEALKEYVRERFNNLLELGEIEEGIFCVLPAGENDAGNVTLIKEKMELLKQL